jgi:hypothetical protein
MSCRGGNETLSTMLRMKITRVQDQALFSLSPNSRIQEVLELDHARTTTATNADADAEDESSSNISSLLASREIDNSILVFGSGVSNAEMNFSRRLQVAPTAGDASASSNINATDPSGTLMNNPWDLYDQLHSFDGSFNDFQAFDTLDNFMPATETSQPLRGGFPVLAPPSPTLPL